LTLSEHSITNLQVTMASCVEPPGSGDPAGTTTTLTGFDPNGHEVTIVLEEQYLT
jgi:hypothetical protein